MPNNQSQQLSLSFCKAADCKICPFAAKCNTTLAHTAPAHLAAGCIMAGIFNRHKHTITSNGRTTHILHQHEIQRAAARLFTFALDAIQCGLACNETDNRSGFCDDVQDCWLAFAPENTQSAASASEENLDWLPF